MTRLSFASPQDAAGLAAFLGRQLRWDKTAAVRLRSGEEGALAAFTRPARFEVLAVGTWPLTEPVRLDITVSAGELLESIDESERSAVVPAPVTGPPWAGLLPPRGGWRPLAEVPAAQARAAASSVIAEFRDRTERLAAPDRTRSALDALAEEIWSRTFAGTPLPLRAVHAAYALGFLPDRGPVAVLTAGPWLRLRTDHGSTALRRAAATGLSLTPVRGS